MNKNNIADNKYSVDEKNNEIDIFSENIKITCGTGSEIIISKLYGPASYDDIKIICTSNGWEIEYIKEQ